MHTAITAVLSGSGSIRSVAKDYDICHVTLSRYVKKAKDIENNSNIINQIVIISLTMFSTGQYGHSMTILGDHFTKVD